MRPSGRHGVRKAEVGAWLTHGRLPPQSAGAGEPRRRLLSFSSSFPSPDQVHRFHSASEKQVRQRLFTGGEGKGADRGGASAHGDPQALPPGCSAGEVRAARRGGQAHGLGSSRGQEGGAPAACRLQTGCGGNTRKEGGPPWPPSHKESACDAGDGALIPGSGRSPGGGNGNPLQYSCLGNPMDRGVGRLQSVGSQRGRHD